MYTHIVLRVSEEYSITFEETISIRICEDGVIQKNLLSAFTR